MSRHANKGCHALWLYTPPASYEVELVDCPSPEVGQVDGGSSSEHKYHHGMRLSHVVSNDRITAPDHFQDVRCISFEFECSAPSWSPGDCAFIRPQNLAPNVDLFLRLMNWESIADKTLRIDPKPGVHRQSHLPQKTTLRHLATHFFDIMGVPRRSFFEMVAHFSTDEDEREKCCEFASAEGQDDLHDYCTRPRRSLLEVLADFASIRDIPLDYIFDVFPAIRPRYFSISSDYSHQTGRAVLTVGIVDYQTKIRTRRRGVCTSWLAKLSPGSPVHLNVTKGTMKLPPDPDVPIIMVGPGTGIAAFIAFIENRIEHESRVIADNMQDVVGVDNVLFFGSRYKDKDFLYGKQLLEWQDKGYLRLFTAFSRDQEEKIYVQHRIVQNAKYLWSLIQDRRAMIFVSGNANRMPDDVRRAFARVFVEQGKMSEQEAIDELRMMERTRQYQEECWY
ncbi:NAPDH-dependent diflavin reductase [Spiromyces aspiralis]|uniref:NAPDH-dependent diflavin reductase n=1 Tax=Spiromyces aspiralis TaxID=68401 RepID=A0ACC1HWQ3_9FUNG|nr:NAPDH-dependent diflavin reductase [Spiromyces aspiralis]